MAIEAIARLDPTEASSHPTSNRLPGLADCREMLAEWRIRRRFRRDLVRLLRLSPHMIEDIGLTLEEVYDEISKPPWRA